MEARDGRGLRGLLPLQCGPHCFLEAEFPLRAAWPLAGWWQITPRCPGRPGKWRRHGDQSLARWGRSSSPLRPRSRGKYLSPEPLSQEQPTVSFCFMRGGIPAAGFAKGQEFLATPRASALWAGLEFLSFLSFMIWWCWSLNLLSGTIFPKTIKTYFP